MKDLTDRQIEVLEVFAELEQEDGYPPSFRRMARKLDITVCGVRDHYEVLERKGCLTKLERTNPKLKRSIYILTDWGRYRAGVPVCKVVTR
jgi:SOS-response transcriptional repressor LexA